MDTNEDEEKKKQEKVFSSFFLLPFFHHNQGCLRKQHWKMFAYVDENESSMMTEKKIDA